MLGRYGKANACLAEVDHHIAAHNAKRSDLGGFQKLWMAGTLYWRSPMKACGWHWSIR